uniref:Uncharacterized protein n=1 Tax=Timema poppense TaxID=170557 RepID=A0A7R9DN10_TIMPO|nr:unnamed protein product [Timema poppensis]
MNANNNTYSCLRTINATHNFLYCEFVTGLITFYNLRIDPFEQWNRVHSLTKEELSYLSDQLTQLRACRGTKQCTVGGASHSQMSLAQHLMSSSHQIHTNRYKKRKYPLSRSDKDKTKGMKFLKSMLAVTRINRIRNKDVWPRAGLQGVREIVEEARTLEKAKGMAESMEEQRATAEETFPPVPATIKSRVNAT